MNAFGSKIFGTAVGSIIFSRVGIAHAHAGAMFA